MAGEPKVDSSVMEAMLKDGKSQRDIARHFNVSEAAISKRVKRLEAENAPTPESFKKLTAKQQRFVLSKVEGKSSTQSALDAFDVSSVESAHQIGIKLSHEPDIELAIQDLMAQEGISRRYRVQRLRTVINAKDLGIAAKGLDLANKLTGEYAAEKIAVAAAVADVSPELQRMINMVTGNDLSGRLQEALKRSREARGATDVMPEGAPQEFSPIVEALIEEHIGGGLKQETPVEAVPDPLAGRWVPRSEWVAREQEERRQQPLPDYKPFK